MESAADEAGPIASRHGGAVKIGFIADFAYDVRDLLKCKLCSAKRVNRQMRHLEISNRGGRSEVINCIVGITDDLACRRKY